MLFTPVVDYHQLYLAPAEVWPEFDVDSDAELVQVMADRRSLILRTGVAMGPVALEVELVQSFDPGLAAWEESAEGRLDIDEPLFARAPTVDTGVPTPVLTPSRAGVYTFRLWSRGRATHYDQVVDTPDETYLLQFRLSAATSV